MNRDFEPAIGTPSNENGSLNLKYLSHAVQDIGDFLRVRNEYHVVCIRSTVLPGTVEKYVVPVLEERSKKRAGQDFGVCMNPEFLREGSSIRDFYNPSKTVVGQLDPRSGDVLASLYKTLPGPLVRVPIRVAEMVKYVDNTFHALKVSFANA